MNPSSSLTGQVAVITGATGGIGCAVAREFHKLGLKLVLTGRSGHSLAQLGAELNASTLTGDISDPTLPAQLLDLALASYGRCDIVMNNAGIIEVAPIESIDIEKVCAMVRVNVEAAYRVAYTFLKHFRHAGEGHLLNVSSVLGT